MDADNQACYLSLILERLFYLAHLDARNEQIERRSIQVSCSTYFVVAQVYIYALARASTAGLYIPFDHSCSVATATAGIIDWACIA